MLPKLPNTSTSCLKKGKQDTTRKTRQKTSTTEEKEDPKNNQSNNVQKEQSIKIFNLSSHILSEAETNLLSKGLYFCPSTKINKFQLFVELNQFIRKLTLTRHFNMTKINSTIIQPPNIIDTRT